MYWQDKWVIKDSIEYEIKYAGKYGAKGEKRAKRKKATPEQIKKQNQRLKEKKMRRLIKANFDKGDLWLTIKYSKGTRKPTEEVKQDMRRFLDTLRRRYKANQEELKFIYRLEIGKQGGIHIHMIVPRIRGSDIETIIQDAWPHGRINYQSMDDSDYESLAKYIVKRPDEESLRQLSFIPTSEQKEYIKYSASRNLIRPEPERKIYEKRTLRKVMKEGLKPTEGYYIDKSSVRMGINQYTGMSYIHYTERRIERIKDG